jgi:hypothetical protein
MSSIKEDIAMIFIAFHVIVHCPEMIRHRLSILSIPRWWNIDAAKTTSRLNVFACLDEILIHRMPHDTNVHHRDARCIEAAQKIDDVE